MRTLFALVITGVFAVLPGISLSEDKVDDPLFVTMDAVDLNELKWKKRPVVVFADSPNDPAFIEQLTLLHARENALRDRDVLVITDTDPEAASALRLKLRPRGFMLALLGKDGQVKLRKPFPWDVREITRSIDKMPMRQREIRDRNG